MIEPSELQALEKDALATYEDVLRSVINYPKGMAGPIFRDRVIGRIEELLEVARNIHRVSYNRDLAGSEKNERKELTPEMRVAIRKSNAHTRKLNRHWY